MMATEDTSTSGNGNGTTVKTAASGLERARLSLVIER